VQDELPASSVDADVVVELADQSAVGDGGFAAVGLVAQVVDVAVDGGPGALGPGAVTVPEQDGAADVAGDSLGVANVERQARVFQGVSSSPCRKAAATPEGPETRSMARRATAWRRASRAPGDGGGEAAARASAIILSMTRGSTVPVTTGTLCASQAAAAAPSPVR
jgi:hypothetical protein